MNPDDVAQLGPWALVVILAMREFGRERRELAALVVTLRDTVTSMRGAVAALEDALRGRGGAT